MSNYYSSGFKALKALSEEKNIPEKLIFEASFRVDVKRQGFGGKGAPDNGTGKICVR